MLRRRLYLQIYAIFIASLVLFTVVASAIWNATGLDQAEEELFHKSTGLAMLLLPPADRPADEQQDAVSKIAKTLDFEISLFDAERNLIVASGVVSKPPEGPIEPGIWQDTEGQTQWATFLPDQRWIVIDIDRLQVPGPLLGMGLLLSGVAIVVGLVTYPFVRYLTGRLERLQLGVERIGLGNLDARVDIEGNDEVASLARSFNRAAGQIESLVTAQRMLLANASHELRTPLARIRLGIEMLLDKNDEARRKALQKDIIELDALIDELILMTRLDSNLKGDLAQTVDLVAIAAEECARYQDCQLSGTMAEISGDARMLQRLVRNLIENAHKHGKPPVSVDISTTPAEVMLIVADGGKGIPEAEREKVFQPFYRVLGEQKVQGYGLGLPLVQRIALAHGGVVRIEPDPQSAISVTFPATALAKD
ncbi:MAG: ATP-binding protein [Pseudomonadota bacterium]